MTPPLVLVAAVGRNRAIGLDGRLPWRLPGDLARFRTLTMHKPVIMGRKTYDSIGRPLPGRALVVVSRGPERPMPAGVELCPSIETALARGAAIAAERGSDEIVVAGGAAIYAALIERADRLCLTEVDLAPEADAVFPEVDLRLWRLVARERPEPAPGDEARFVFAAYARR